MKFYRLTGSSYVVSVELEEGQTGIIYDSLPEYEEISEEQYKAATQEQEEQVKRFQEAAEQQQLNLTAQLVIYTNHLGLTREQAEILMGVRNATITDTIGR